MVPTRDTYDAEGTSWYGMGTFCPPKANFVLGLPGGTVWKNVLCLFTAGWEWDGKVGSHLVDGMERDYTISWWDGIEERVGNTGGKSVGSIVGKSVENTVGKHCREWLGTRWGTGAGDNR